MLQKSIMRGLLIGAEEVKAGAAVHHALSLTATRAPQASSRVIHPLAKGAVALRLQCRNLAGLRGRKREAYRMPPRRVQRLPQVLCKLNHRWCFCASDKLVVLAHCHGDPRFRAGGSPAVALTRLLKCYDEPQRSGDYGQLLQQTIHADSGCAPGGHVDAQ